MTEIWKEVAGYPFYDVSNIGRVRSWNKKGRGQCRMETPRILKPSIVKNGYLVVNLCKNGAQITHYVHRLIALSHLKETGRLVLHKDGNRTNNVLENLYFGTHADNIADAIRHGTWARGETQGNAKLSEKDVFEIRGLLAKDVLFQREIGELFNVRQSTISRISNGKRWGHLNRGNEGA